MTEWRNRRALAAILLIVAAGVLQGCVYNPYTGTYTPCCAGYPAYRGYYGAPQGGGYQGQGYQGPAPQGQGYQGPATPGPATPRPGYQGQGPQGQGYQGQVYQAPTP